MKDSRPNKDAQPLEWSWEFSLKTAILINLSIEQFDYMTPYELSLCIEAHMERQEAEMKDRLTLVWLGEYYHRTKRLPSLQKELKKITGEEKPVMTDEQMLEMVKNLNAQFGGAHIKGGE
jgi:hypothetical protein